MGGRWAGPREQGSRYHQEQAPRGRGPAARGGARTLPCSAPPAGEEVSGLLGKGECSAGPAGASPGVQGGLRGIDWIWRGRRRTEGSGCSAQTVAGKGAHDGHFLRWGGGRTVWGIKPPRGNDKWQLLLLFQGPGESGQAQLGGKGSGTEAPLSPVVTWSALTSRHLATWPTLPPPPPPNTF